MDSKLHISVSPHIRCPRNTQHIMADVLIALLPATVAGIVLFGLSALWVVLTCVATSVFCEFLFNVLVKKDQTVGDLSAAVTGLLLALNLSANIPLWQAAVGSVFAIVIVKCMFGGIGCNMVNPAITARVFMLVAFSSVATAAFPPDAVSTATPLAQLEAGTVPDLLDLFLGNVGGAIGETCVPALLIGGLYLVARRVIRWQLPIAFIATVFVFTFAVTQDATVALAHVLSGGLMIGAIFMATDYVTSPPTVGGKIVFGIGAGIITVLIRLWGNYPEGVSFAILLMNILNPFIEQWTTRKVFGLGGKKA